MKNKHSKFFTMMIAICLMISPFLYSQDKPNTIVHEQDHPFLGPDKKPGIYQPPAVSENVQVLLQQQKQAKLNGDNTNVLNIQRQIDELTGSVTTTAVQSGTVRYVGDDPRYQTDNIVNSRVFANPNGSFIKATALAVEQRGSNIGRMWMDIAWGNGTNGVPDTILTLRSDNGGVTWAGYSLAIPGGFAKVNNDELDIEIMEYTTGEKYVYTLMGITANTGQQFANVIIYQTPTYAGNLLTLVWPGGTTNTNTYRPRVTSDNANYPTASSWLFIIASRDTLTAANTHKIGEKFVKCTNPFTVNPTFTYKNNALAFDQNYGGAGTFYNGADHCDIAYFTNGGNDSLIFLESNLPDTTAIYLYKSSESPEATASSLSFTYLNSGLGNFLQKQFARVVSNGNSTIMIAYRCNFSNSGDWDIRYAKSTLGGVQSAGWTNGYIDGIGSTVTYPYQPDLFGLRGTSSFKCTYTYFNTGIDSAMIISAPNGTWANNPTRVSLNGVDVSISASPHACFRFVNNDSCFADWSEYSASNVWAATGCTGTIVTGVNHNGNEIPKTYSLSQNYPNPFNPNTNIKFSIPKNSFVKLVVFDVTGQEVASIVNEQLNAGNYSYNFDASNIATGVYFYKIQADGFSDVKKMMLIK